MFSIRATAVSLRNKRASHDPLLRNGMHCDFVIDRFVDECGIDWADPGFERTAHALGLLGCETRRARVIRLIHEVVDWVGAVGAGRLRGAAAVRRLLGVGVANAVARGVAAPCSTAMFVSAISSANL